MLHSYRIIVDIINHNKKFNEATMHALALKLKLVSPVGVQEQSQSQLDVIT